ncbi:unnamed protein product [Brachionus calyciflorus]|uniref:Uncharacterized protein n=1 Tax=Brachionus calyciflorus TaxID=104777 RepID=A0A814HQQ2_9BILA|nr:unnamed protein product [Brachionus calyciflorus]
MSNDLTEWYLGKLISKKIYNIWNFDSKSDLKISEENFSYNETSRKVSKRVINPNMFYSLEEVFEYDQFGNLIKETKKGRKSREEFEERTTQYDYDNLGINKIKETNPLGHYTYFFYDTNDNLVQLIEANNVTTNYTYNSVGQKIFESIEGKSNSSSEYFFFNGIKNSVYCISNSVFGRKKITSCYDSLKRQVRKTTNGFDGELIHEDTVYNQNGLVEKQSLPYKAFEEEPKYTRFEYDDLMREISRYEPNFANDIDEKIEIIYRANHVITSDSTGFLKIETKNLLGKIARVEDGERSISFYEYDAFRNLVNIIDPQNVSTNMSFDNNGEKVKNFDPYMGFSEHEYNSFGELIATFNQDGTVIKTERDLLGRIIKLVEPDGTTIKKYDSGLFSFGKLSSLSVLSGYQVDTKFDRYGRQILKNYLYDSNDKYAEEFEYDEFGRVSAIQVQNVNGSKFKIFYCYKNGYLAALSVDDKDCIRFVWKAVDYGSNQKIKEEQYGNGVKNKYSFDETEMVTQIHSTRNIQLINNLKYDYDVRRNLLKSEEFDPLASKKFIKKYSYDSLDRLVSASHFESTHEKTSLENVQSCSYDNIGNILHHVSSKQQSVYNYDPDKPQLATMVGSEKVVYDNYGRIIKTDSYSIDWYSFSKPRSIRQKNSTIEYLYGGDKENIMKKITNDKKSLRINHKL